MKDECLICGAPLVYSERDTQAECAVCRKSENTKTVCEKGHYVCDECHESGVDAIMGVCLASKSDNPIEIIRELMELPACHMHGPEHHIMVGSTPLKNKEWALSNSMTSKALGAIAACGGPRCCKRNSYVAAMTAAEFSEKYLGVKMRLDKIKCIHSHQNNQCIKERCPFN